MAGVKISNLPALATPALTDIYATVQGGVTYKVTLAQIADTAVGTPTVRLATTAALTAIYNNGSSGVGATLTNNGALAALSIDGVSVVVDDRILIKDQASTFQNGIYIVTTIGSGAVAWVLTRAADYDSVAEIDAGDFFTVALGTTNAKTQWIQTAVVATIGTDPITFESNVVAGNNIAKSNNTISVTPNGQTAGKLFRSNGTIWAASTSTLADTFAINSIPYASAANTITALAPALSSVMVTSSASTGVPTWVGPLTNGQVIIGSTGAIPVANTLTSGIGISISNGAGAITINASGGGLATATIAGTTQSAAVNTQYVALNAGQTTVTLPATCAVGDIISLIGSTSNTGGWILDAPAGDTIRVLSSTTSAGGTVTSTAQAGECIEVICEVADTSWVARNFVSTLLTTA